MVTAEFMPEVFGGAEQQCRKLSRELVKLGVGVTILSGAVDKNLPEREVEDGVVLHRLFCRRNPQRAGRNIVSTLGFILRVGRWARQNRESFDLIHAHQAKINAVAAVYAARQIGVPSIVKVGSAGDHKFDFAVLERKRPFVGRPFARFVRDRATRTIAISTDLVRMLSEYGVIRDHIVHIPNGVNLPDLHDRQTKRISMRRKLGLKDEHFCMMFVGRLAHDKNLECLLAATAMASESDGNLRLMIVGDGEARERLTRMAHTLGIAQIVRFAGQVDNVEGHLSACDLFVLPAHAEGMSNALLEAMSMACPSAASRVSGNVDLINHGETGWLFDPDAPDDLAELMRNASTMPSSSLRAVGAAARAKLERHHGIQVIAGRYLALYESLIDQRPVA